jgi:3-oxoacyl-[acyl-carrier-protein] synthase-3
LFTIEQVGTFVPETSCTVQDLRDPLGLKDSQVLLYTRFLGLSRVAVAPDVSLGQMLCRAGESALRGVDRGSVRFLIHAHTMQHAAPPSQHLLEQVRDELGLHSASVLGLSHQNCVIGLHALQVARFLLAASDDENDRALIVTGDKILSRSIHLIPDTTIMGEAAAAAVVGRDPRGDRILGRAIRILGRFYQSMACPEPLAAEYKQIYAETFSEVMAAALADAHLDPGQVAAVLPHNVNRLSWKKVAAGLGIPLDRVYLDNVPRTGHCFASDPLINLDAARAAGRVGPGDVVLMASAGLGATFAATVVQIGQGVPR